MAAFARLANGDVAPVRSIAGQPTMISRAGHNVEYDPINDEMWHANPEAQAILVFRGGANGEEAPIRVIQGPHTLLAFPNYGVGVDAVHNEVFVVEKEYISVYPRTANGDVAPIRVIRGPDTGLANARAIIVDPVRNVLIVGTNNGLVILDRTANGNAKPRAIIAGPMSGIRASKPPHSGPLTRDEIEARRRGNTGAAIQSMRMSPKGYIVTLVGGRGRGGDDDEDSAGAAEDAGEDRGGGGGRAGRGPGGGPAGIAAWNIDDFLKVSGHGDVPPVYVLSDPKGVVGPGRVALNPNQKEVILGGNRIVMYSFPEIF